MKPIPNHPNYLISTNGEIYSLHRNKLIAQATTKKGYLQVKLYTNKQPYNLLVHRLVALTYLPNPDNLTDVNHKDCNKANNHVDNLEWCTHSDNLKHAYINGRIPEHTLHKGK